MKFFQLLLIILLIFSGPELFSDNPNTKLSHQAQIVLKDYKSNKKKISESLLERRHLPLRIKSGSYYLSALIKIDDISNSARLDEYGVHIRTKAGSILTADIPVNSMEELSEQDFIKYIHADTPLSLELDSARSSGRLNDVLSNSEALFDTQYDGTGVVVGIIDGGFDFTHVEFLDKQTEKNRLSKVWIQNEEGDPPSAFDYGWELTPLEIQQVLTDDEWGTHGTHVASIAAGSGLGNELYAGVAGNSELVFVAYKSSSGNDAFQGNIIDGISYIFDYAESQGKPGVVNISLGTHFGPHDGTTLFDEAIDALTGPGRIVVKSAGNSGRQKVFVYNDFSLDTDFGMLTRMSNPSGGFDFWGTKGEEFCVKVHIVDEDNQTIDSESDWICTSDDNTGYFDIKLNGKQVASFDTYAKTSEYNGRPRISLNCRLEEQLYLYFLVEGNNGEVFVWKNSYSDSNPFIIRWFEDLLEGNTQIGITEPGNGKEIITVGAYISKTGYRDIEGSNHYNNSHHSLGRLAGFSSNGPSADGRIKPDITAPGDVIVAAVNSQSELYAPDGHLKNLLVADAFDYWYYGALQGTSMSAPFVSGAIALMLQADPTLTPVDIKNIFRATAQRDIFTGDTGPNSKSNSWGWGKIDIYEALKAVLNINSVADDVLYSGYAYPNPASGVVYLKHDNPGKYTLSVYSLEGIPVMTEKIDFQGGVIPIDISGFSKGTYMIRLNGKDVNNYRVVVR
ncbi:MAG: S8/S53 family peptidase [Candidatus Kapaibacterium sp.]